MAELSGLEVLALAKEIESGLRGTYVKNVYSLGAAQILRLGGGGSEDALLVASPSAGAWISKLVSERGETTPFTTRLRQELVRARFVSARQLGGDRVYDLAFEGDAAKHLIVELMPPGNIVVADAAMKVSLAAREFRTKARRVVRGEPYSAPPQRRKAPAEATAADVERAAEAERSAGAAVGRTFSLPRKYVAEALARAGLTEQTPAAELAARAGAVAEALQRLLREASEAPVPCLCGSDRGDEILVVTPLAHELRRRGETVSEICDEVLLAGAGGAEPEAPSEAETRRRELEATIKRLGDEAGGFRAEAGRLRREAARASGAATPEEAEAALKAAGAKQPRGGTSAAAASAIYDLAKGFERKAADSEAAAADLKKRLGRIPAASPRKRREIRREGREWYEKFRWFFTREGKLAVGGRDAQTNSVLVRRHLEPNDSVYHADLFGSPFFVLKGGAAQTAEEAAEVAQATVAFSSAWKTGLGAADAYWVAPDQVSTSAPSGEYLPRGGFLIRGRKNPMTKVLVELAVGLDPGGRVLSGPESAIAASSVAYVVLRPHREKGSETAKRVLKDLEALAGGRAEALPTVDDVLRMLPAGGGKVLRKRSATPDQRNL